MAMVHLTCWQDSRNHFSRLSGGASVACSWRSVSYSHIEHACKGKGVIARVLPTWDLFPVLPMRVTSIGLALAFLLENTILLNKLRWLNETYIRLQQQEVIHTQAFVLVNWQGHENDSRLVVWNWISNMWLASFSPTGKNILTIVMTGIWKYCFKGPLWSRPNNFEQQTDSKAHSLRSYLNTPPLMAEVVCHREVSQRQCLAWVIIEPPVSFTERP